ncbi:MAG: ACT domain-containing protein [Bryobacteraceae bacterium]
MRERLLRDQHEIASLCWTDAVRAIEDRTRQVDEIVCSAYREMLAVSGSPPGLALLAVGGYGRRQLFPHSDIDLTILAESEKLAESLKPAISPFLQRLWDEGLRLSQSVRTPAECCELHDRNIELNISLLDQRFLTGDQALYDKLAARLPRFVHGHATELMRNLSRLTRERHAKYHDTIHHLEPNIKEAPGGLRDLQLIDWMSRIRTEAGQASLPAAELDAARQFFFSLRCFLHEQTGRDNNILTFPAQEEAAERAGASDPSVWMRDYFIHARTVYRAATRMIETCDERSPSLFAQLKDFRSRLSNADFSVVRNRIYFRGPQQLDADPGLVLRLAAFIARHGLRLSPDAEDRLAAKAPALESWFAQPRPHWNALAEIFSLPHFDMAVRALHDTGGLRAMFPELAGIECLVIRDFYHRYTVDEHTLVCIQTLAEPGDRHFANLLEEIDDRPALIFALLFHDAGKSSEDEGHVDGSLRVVEGAMERIQMPLETRETVRFLIRRHLDLSAAMTSRDLEDPDTAAETARKVETVERLKALTLLTYADISAVNPNAMTPWRSDQLWRLYLVTYNELTRELETDRIANVLPENAVPESSRQPAFLEGFPTRYLRTHTREEIAGHAGMESRCRERGLAVEIEKTGGVYRLTLVTTDRPFLFASVAGTLSSFGMNIVKAEAFSNRWGLVLDTFRFADTSRTLDLNPPEIDRLRHTLERVVLGKLEVKELLQNRPKTAAPSRRSSVEPGVSFDGEASASATLIQIVAEDRPGLLFDLSRAISQEGCNIEVVLIDTEAHKAIDVFYVTSRGQKLDEARRQSLEMRLLAACRVPSSL